tara:strand:- start:2769 stop:3221 length:453 start_codon:yes stop_codon:yes gene_type:complete
MKINVDRMAVLAGIPNNGRARRLNETKYHEGEMPEMEMTSEDYTEEGEMPEGDGMASTEDLEEIIEVDEVMLVQELRRAKKLMQESRKRKSLKFANLQEAQLKSIIESEIGNVLKDLNLNSSWVYGGNKPKRSRRGYTHQGSYLKGIGFK